jgi:GT2 family glycosyltransferase/SAM-dependent methyltransferase
VVPVHDYADVVTDALDSVHAQTLDDLDLVVVDDGSTDASLATVRAWADDHRDRFNRLVVAHHRRNAGLARTRNTGFDLAETPLALPLDADNMLLPDCCERLLAALDDSAAAYAYPRIRHVGESSRLFPDGHVRGYLPYVPQRLVGSNYIDAMALVRVAAWLAVGGYRDGLGGWEDYDLWCRLAEAGLHGVQVPEDLALYRVHAGSMLHTVTHSDDRLAEVRDAITDAHPWLRLESTGDPGAADDRAGPGTPAPVRPRPPAGPDRAPAADRPDIGAADRPGLAAPAPAAAAAADDGAPAPVEGRRGTAAPGLGDRARELLPLLRCPETGEPLAEDAGGGLRSVPSGRRWPVVDGRPVLVPGRPAPVAAEPGHVGNPLPRRARDLIASAGGPVLHLSGGGTDAGGGAVVEADGALFGPTDVVVDAHALPFDDATFALVVAMNAFEHYRDPGEVARQVHRVLRPGGLVLVQTAFLQPLHEAPDHYFNVTRYGLQQWFAGFEAVDIGVPDNLHPGYALAWLASDAEAAVADELTSNEVAGLRATSLGEVADLWRDPATRPGSPAWAALATLGPAARERLAAGFEYLGRR